jgi:hypothetical protein
MSIEEFNKQIESLNSQIDKLRAEMASCCDKFLAETKSFASGWIPEYVQKVVTSRPGVAKELGSEKIKKLKLELADIVSRVPALVDQHVNTDENWTHKKQTPAAADLEFGRYSAYGNTVPKHLDAAVRRVLWHAQDLHKRHGFPLDDHLDRYDPENHTGAPRFKGWYDWSGQMRAAVESYAKLHHEFARLVSEMESIRRKKAEFEAKTLWDEA